MYISVIFGHICKYENSFGKFFLKQIYTSKLFLLPLVLILFNHKNAYLTDFQHKNLFSTLEYQYVEISEILVLLALI